MLSIDYIRENKEKVKTSAKNKGREIGESNNVITPAGGYSMAWDDGNAVNKKGMLQASFSPAPDDAGGFIFISS